MTLAKRLVPLLSLLVSAPALAELPCPAPEALSPITEAQSFTQTRILSGVDRPLVSRGSVLVTPEAVEWTVTDPVEVKTRMAEDGIFQSVMGGPEEPVQAGGAANPIVSDSGLIALLRGDFTAVDTYYDTEKSALQDGDWQVQMAPKSDSMSAYVTDITVTGCQAIETIRLRQTNGDEMHVTFGTE
jgi:hypothetical protein